MEMKTEIKNWLDRGTIDVFLGYKMVSGHPLPHCFSSERPEELADLVVGSTRYSLEKIATHIAAIKPDVKIGMLARDCNQRALNVLAGLEPAQPGQHPNGECELLSLRP